MNWLNKLKPTKGDVYIKSNALPESDYETATGRALYTITAMKKAYDAGQHDERKAQPEQPSQAGELSDDDCRNIYNAAMNLPNRNIVSVMRYIIAHTAAQPRQEPVGKFARFTDGIWREVTDGSAGVPLYTTPQAQRILELEALLERQTALLEHQTSRIVDLQTHIENLEGEDR